VGKNLQKKPKEEAKKLRVRLSLRGKICPKATKEIKKVDYIMRLMDSLFLKKKRKNSFLKKNHPCGKKQKIKLV
jgi:hypothetical protein